MTASAISTNLPDWQADCVILFRRPDNSVANAVIVEIQLDYDRQKPLRWPEYVAVTHGRHLGCPTELLVVCFRKAVARWASKPISLSLSGSVIRPVVVAPEDFPRIDDPEVAVDLPALAALSLAAHPDDRRVGTAVVAALESLYKQDPNKADVYHDFLLGILTRPGRKLLEELMTLQTEGYVFQSAFARRHIAKGEAKGEAKAVLRVLARRNISVGAADQARIMACRDLATLDTWLDRALVVTTAQELFA